MDSAFLISNATFEGNIGWFRYICALIWRTNEIHHNFNSVFRHISFVSFLRIHISCWIFTLISHKQMLWILMYANDLWWIFIFLHDLQVVPFVQREICTSDVYDYIDSCQLQRSLCYWNTKYFLFLFAVMNNISREGWTVRTSSTMRIWFGQLINTI